MSGNAGVSLRPYMEIREFCGRGFYVFNNIKELLKVSLERTRFDISEMFLFLTNPHAISHL